VWQGYKKKCGIDLDTSLYGKAIHPLELYDTSETTTLYRHGAARTDCWDRVNGALYYINKDGYPLRGGWRWTNNIDKWKYFGPTGIQVNPLQVSPGSMLNTNKRMDMGWQTWPGFQVQIWSRTGGGNERWDIFPLGGYWYMQSRLSEKYLAIPEGKIYNGAAVIQWDFTAGSEQKWNLVKFKNGFYQFRYGMNNNYVIDVRNGSTANGNKLQLFVANGTPAQYWRFMEQW
jgi:hypothetical protein